MDALTPRQQSLRFELSAAIMSFRERLVSLAQYNIEDMDDLTKHELFTLLHHDALRRVPDSLMSFTQEENGDG